MAQQLIMTPDIPIIRLFLILLLLTKTVHSLSLGAIINDNNNYKRIQLKASPLIGGPSWLPLHCKVVVDDGAFVFDYIPKNPTSTDTLQKLMTLQNVPAEARIRIRTKPSTLFRSRENDCADETDFPGGDVVSLAGTVHDDDDDNVVTKITNNDQFVHRAVQFCNDYDKDLHLITNNCWTFAFDLIRNIVFFDGDTYDSKHNSG